MSFFRVSNLFPDEMRFDENEMHFGTVILGMLMARTEITLIEFSSFKPKLNFIPKNTVILIINMFFAEGLCKLLITQMI